MDGVLLTAVSGDLFRCMESNFLRMLRTICLRSSDDAFGEVVCTSLGYVCDSPFYGGYCYGDCHLWLVWFVSLPAVNS